MNKNKSKKILSILVALFLCCGFNFKIYANSIDKVSQKWINNGWLKGNGQEYGLNNYITKAEVITLINKSFGFNDSKPFSPAYCFDVDESKWYYSEFCKAVNANYIAVDENGKFNGEQYITRAELAEIVSKLKYFDYKIEYFENENHWAYQSINLVLYNKLMSLSDGQFYPQQNITKMDCIITLDLVLKNGQNFYTSEYKEEIKEEKEIFETIATKSVLTESISDAEFEGTVYVNNRQGTYFDIKGDNLYLVDKTYEFSLNNSTLNKIYIQKGSSINIHNSNIDEIYVESNCVLNLTGTSSVNNIYVSKSCSIYCENQTKLVELKKDLSEDDIVKLNGNFSDLKMKGGDGKIYLLRGKIENLIISSGEKTYIYVAENAIIDYIDSKEKMNITGLGEIVEIKSKEEYTTTIKVGEDKSLYDDNLDIDYDGDRDKGSDQEILISSILVSKERLSLNIEKCQNIIDKYDSSNTTLSIILDKAKSFVDKIDSSEDILKANEYNSQLKSELDNYINCITGEKIKLVN